MLRRWVNVIVAAGLVILCVGLLFPARCRVREAAARMACANNLKQLSLALHNFAANNPQERGARKLDAFPAGTVPNADLPPEQRLSWLVPLLPYIEEDAAFRPFDLTRGAADPRNQSPARHHIRALVCPGSGEYDSARQKWKSATPLTHYVGVAGVGADAATLPPGHARAGVFGYDRRAAVADDIPDGTSNTLLLIETAQNPGHWAYGGPATVRALEPGIAPYLGDGCPFGGWTHSGKPWFSEGKSSTCEAALADGSVKTFANATAPAVLDALATVAGGETLPADW